MLVKSIFSLAYSSGINTSITSFTQCSRCTLINLWIEGNHRSPGTKNRRLINSLGWSLPRSSHNCAHIYHNPRHGSDAEYMSNDCQDGLANEVICEKEERLMVDYFQHFLLISSFRCLIKASYNIARATFGLSNLFFDAISRKSFNQKMIQLFRDRW